MKKLITLCLALCATAALWAAFTPAAFTVSAGGKQVLFSQGNLQCSGIPKGNYTWAFAENQYDMIGTANVASGTASCSYACESGDCTCFADKIDLFGWSASEPSAFWGINTSTTQTDYWGSFIDWGQKTISNNAPNTYRTLTYDEWNYLLNSRTDADKKKGIARINLSTTEYVNGLILLPDDWTDPEGVTFKSGFGNGSDEVYYTIHQSFTLDQWQKLEAKGAVFLPASGSRFGTVINYVRESGYYWSATPLPTLKSYAHNLYFDPRGSRFDYNHDRLRGQAVRLVKDIKYNITLAAPEHGTLTANTTASPAGETVTLTISSNKSYYVPKTITVLQGTTPVETTAVAGTSYQYTFMMPAGEVTVSVVLEKATSAFTPTAFTVSAGKQVLFSQGNLQCSGVATDTYTWAFAEFQTEMIGSANVSDNKLADKIDLFGWSGRTGSAKWGISTSKTISDYAGSFVDWGTNAIGTSAANTYRTLTKDEWEYLLNTRDNASEKKGVARIHLNGDGSQYANGLILLPDSWELPEGVAFKSGFADSYDAEAYATYQTFTFAQWQKLEAAGAVFLPASAYRLGSDMKDVQTYGNYWSATMAGSDYANYLSFLSNGTNMYSADLCNGQSVRLVREVSSPVTALQPAESIALYTENGRVICTQNFQIFTLTGQNVTELNGQLNGVYIVKIGDKAQKIAVSSKK